MKIRYVFVLGMVVLLMSAIAAPNALAHGGDPSLVHACIRNVSKVVRIVGANENCRPKSETPMHWSREGGFIVRDSLGNVVGRSPDGVYVSHKIGDEQIYLPLIRHGFWRNSVPNFYFPTPDCTGQAYLASLREHYHLFFEYAHSLKQGGKTAYFAASPAQTLNYQSQRPIDSSSCITGEGSVTAGIAIPITIESLGFHPPFELE